MGFYSTKPAFRAWLRPLAKRVVRIHPDIWTWAAVAVATLAGGLLWVSRAQPMVLPVIAALLFLRLVLNVFDGVVAQEAGIASARGEALSEFADRIADVTILGSVAASGVASAGSAVAALVIVLLISYVGILGKAVGAGRQYGGLMGKPDRMVVLMVACAAQWAVSQGWIVWPGPLGWATPFDAGSAVIILLGLYTIAVRLWVILRTVGGR